MLGQLVPAGGGPPIELLKDRVIIGRSDDCDIVVPSRAVSSRHCELRFHEGCWFVRDLNSRNGIAVHGKRVTKKKLLPMQILSVPKMRFRIEYDAAEPTTDRSKDSVAIDALNAVDAQETAPTTIESPQSQSSSPPVSKDSPTPESTDSVDKPRADKTAPQSARPTGRRYLGKLVPKGGGDPVALLEEKLLIGRSRSAHIRIKHSSVSGRHCSLTWNDGYWFVEDLNSSNGVRVNGEKVQQKILMPGDILSVSTRVYNIEYTAEGEPPADPGLMSKSLMEKAGLVDIMKSDKQPAWITSHVDTDNESRKYNLNDEDP